MVVVSVYASLLPILGWQPLPLWLTVPLGIITFLSGLLFLFSVAVRRVFGVLFPLFIALAASVSARWLLEISNAPFRWILVCAVPLLIWSVGFVIEVLFCGDY